AGVFAFILVEPGADKAPKLIEDIREAEDDPRPDGSPDMGGELPGHQPALNGKGQGAATEIGGDPEKGGDLAEELVGGEIHVLGAEEDHIKNEALEGKGHTGDDHHGQGGADQMPSEFLQMVQEGHLIRAFLFSFCHYRIPSFIRLWIWTTPA